MAVKKYKPTSAGRRQMATSSFEEITTSTPEKSLLEPLKKTGGRNAHGRIRPGTRAAATSGGTAGSTSSASRTACRRRSPPSSTTRTGRRGSRCSTTRTVRRRTSSPLGLRVGATVQAGPGADIKPGNALPSPTSRRAPSSTPSGYPARAPSSRARRARGPARREGRPYGVLRLPSGEMRRVLPHLSRDQAGRQHRPLQRVERQGRPQPLARQAPERARHGDEPRRPPARRRRGQVEGPSPRHAVGRPDDREAHPGEAQGIRQVDRPRPSPRQGASLNVTVFQEGPFVEAARPRRGDERRRREADDPHLVARLHGLPRDGRAHDRGARRAQARAGVRVRADGRAQARRVRAHTDVPVGTRATARHR